jgi:hypothetical protein
VLQNYLWRWEIEVNFRDEKTLLGVGDAQVRTEPSAAAVPAVAVASYGMLLLAAARAFGAAGIPDALPVPAWRRNHLRPRASTMSLIQHLRYELWATAIRSAGSSGFFSRRGVTQKPEKPLPQLLPALMYSRAG